MQELKGIGASAGIAIAKAYRLEEPDLTVEKKNIADAAAEVSRFDEAIVRSKEELEKIKEHALKELGQDKADIFSAHLLVLSDPELLNPVKEKISTDSVNAEFALKETASMFVTMFESMDNEYMKERAADIRDVTKRVTGHLLGVEIPNPSMISEEVVIVAEDLTPSDTAQLNRQFVKGFTTDIGGRTSHSAIMARSLEIPAVVGTKAATGTIENGVTVIVDGIDGDVIIDPSSETLKKYEEKHSAYLAQKAEWAKLVNEPTVSKDGHHVELAANIGTPDDVKGVLENGGEAVGLYRTEFLYMGRDQLPTEDEQFDAYKTVLERMEGKSVVVRTLDIGGDKELPYLQLPKEMNPFLGYRAIRLCLEEQEIFRTQLRALLRASTYGNLKIMFPMIATVNEFKQAKAILLEEKEKLVKAGVTVSDDIEVGMMVEIPSTAVIADQFATEVDFFSIGTNDLIQYTMAADRMNERVAYLYQPYNPAILRLITLVIEAAHKEGKWVGMCGEMAGDEIAIPILLGLGLDEFSMSATSILPARTQISKLSKKEAESFKETILSMSTTEEVVAFVKETFNK
ncbi:MULTISPECIES: phosphoenolpyruvate--protein phosphotransferase [Bacillus]|jgi:phosphotransferase system enzyme I (PtsI)|uniref:Phosphoenolpyruvate-protein phosphotransferase n=2 Tax=Bacillus amyloliquefaciens TaxID=1390 RepID=A0A9P1NHH7_BACAS|nr:MULTISPECIES: phosphoenolpyruvate--protein phosphotransferase [Bacillus]AIW33412.1 phosphoenolpyruvate-protein phosphotransferase [Bacillus subtilis]AEB24205.1 phosphotransferase system (PTS) enzyme I [Bacillus amyloliquefaciens TA208]AEB63036.1 phosphotransferase system (PTS) enzyme I [Bacillus amyloliquefaciens LL3]AEK89211.1 phosphoenolpyruvate-protein phosphotransferase [Bacillus amyloliquefaciens XH7]AME05513.1 phosphoenolpyruvate--protein phosphotransferase [Bacillus sp. SDLI1]